MPGFRIGSNNSDDGKYNAPLPYYSSPVFSYTWMVEDLFGEMPRAPRTNRSLIYVKDCTLPDFQLDSIKYDSPSTTYQFASRGSWNDVKLTFYDTKDLIKTLYSMRDKIWDAKDGIKQAINYKRNSAITVYTASYNGDNDGEISAKWILVNSWISNLSQSPLTYESSAMHECNVTLKYDYAYIDDRPPADAGPQQILPFGGSGNRFITDG